VRGENQYQSALGRWWHPLLSTAKGVFGTFLLLLPSPPPLSRYVGRARMEDRDTVPLPRAIALRMTPQRDQEQSPLSHHPFSPRRRLMTRFSGSIEDPFGKVAAVKERVHLTAANCLPFTRCRRQLSEDLFSYVVPSRAKVEKRMEKARPRRNGQGNEGCRWTCSLCFCFCSQLTEIVSSTRLSPKLPRVKLSATFCI